MSPGLLPKDCADLTVGIWKLVLYNRPQYYSNTKLHKFEDQISIVSFNIKKTACVKDTLQAKHTVTITTIGKYIMRNNDVLRRIRYTFNFTDSKMIALFGLAEYSITRAQLSDWLKKEDDPAFKNCSDVQLAAFLNGLINDKRGKKDGPQARPEKRINNNIILRKLKIACNLKDDEILHILALSELPISKHELSAFFRKPEHKNFRSCKDQVLRNFLQGLQRKYRSDQQPEIEFSWK